MRNCYHAMLQRSYLAYNTPSSLYMRNTGKGPYCLFTIAIFLPIVKLLGSEADSSAAYPPLTLSCKRGGTAPVRLLASRHNVGAEYPHPNTTPSVAPAAR